GQNRLERSPARAADRRQNRRLEPASMLVGTFEIQEGGRATEAERRLVEHGAVARARLEPDVEDVLFASEGFSAAVGTRRVGREEFLGIPLVPDAGTVRTDEVANVADGLRGQPSFVTGLTLKHGDRHPPRSLTADAPVGPERDHRLDSVLAPGR